MRRPASDAVLAFAALAAVVLAAGCGGGGDGDSDEGDQQTTAATTTTALPPAKITVLTATMTGGAAIPKGPAAGAGTARITLNPRTGQACWTLTVRGTDKPLSAHVHEGAAGKLGQVVIPLGDRFSRKGCVLSNPRALRTVAGKPGGYYVDVHTSKYLQGAVRGQLDAASS